MANNRVEIVVVGKNATKPEFDAARRDAKSLPDRVEIKVVTKNDTKANFKEIAADATETGVKVGGNIGRGASGGLRAAMPALIAVLGGAAAGAAPMLGGTIAGAVMGTGGVGGILGGIALASTSPRVRQAAKGAGKSIFADLVAEADVFIKPVLRGINIIEEGFDSARGNISRILDQSARWVEPLAETVSSLINDITSGLADMLEGSDQPVQVLLAGLRLVGDTIEDMFRELADDGPEAAMALHVAFDVLAGTVEAVAETIEFLTNAFGVLVKFGAFGREYAIEFAAMEAAAQDAKGPMDDAATSIRDIGKEAGATSTELKNLANEIKGQTDPAFDLINKMHDLEDAQKDYNKALKEHGEKSPEAKRALRNLAEAALGMTTAASKVDGSFSGKLTPSMKALFRSAGLTKKQINGLEQQMKQAKRAADRLAGTYNVNIQYRVKGSGRALAIRNEFSSGVGGMAHGGIKGAANGATSSGLTWVGEQGPELVELPPSTRVHPAGTSKRMAEGVPSSQKESVQLEIYSSGRQLDDMLLEILRESIRVRGGDVQLVLGQVS